MARGQMDRTHSVGMLVLAGLAVAALSNSVFAAAVGVDGTIGADWAGVTPVHVTYDSTAPTGNFGAPTSTTSGAGYDIYVRDDGNYYYVAETITDHTALSAGSFMNLYVDVDPSALNGSDLGFEVENHDAFTPGVNGSNTAYTTATSGIVDAVSADGSTLEFAVPNSFFYTNPLGMASWEPTDGTVTLRLSQAFGYSVAGGASYGSTRLGSASIAPEPASLSLLALGAIGLIARRRRQAI